LSSTDQSIPVPLSWTVSRCLAKDAADRYESTGDLARDLHTIAGHVSGSGLQPIVRRSSRVGQPTLVAVAVIAAVAGWLTARAPATPDGSDDTPIFQQLTFRRGILQSARFTADGANIVYGGAWDGKPFQLSVVHGDSSDAQALDLPPAGLFSVSGKGDLAIARDCSWVPAGQQCRGTLAIAPLAAGGPRNIVEDVIAADWAPDGTLALIRRLNGRPQLEYPAGRVLRQSNTLSHLRFSRDGRQIAFFDSTKQGVNNFELMIADADGSNRRSLDAALRFPNGLSWSPDGKELWFSDNSEQRDDEVYAVTLDGRRRSVFRQAGNIRLLDVARDGRALLARSEDRADMLIRAGGQVTSYPWLDFTVAEAISNDGRTAVFSERGGGNELPSYSLFARDLDGSPPVFLGEGRGMAISPDKKWVLANRSNRDAPTELIAYPTGVGSAQTIGPAVNPTGRADFLPDSARVVFGASRPERGTYLTSLASPKPVRVAHVTGTIDSPLAPDGDRFFVRQDIRSARLERLSGPVTSPAIIALKPNEYIQQWTVDGASVYIVNLEDPRAKRVDRLELATGRRTEVSVVRPQELAGLIPGFSMIHLTPDGRTLLYSETRSFSVLILATGLR
jgi:hypothetical protein